MDTSNDALVRQILGTFEGNLLDGETIARVGDVLHRNLPALRPVAYKAGWWVAILAVLDCLDALKIDGAQRIKEKGSGSLEPEEVIGIILGMAEGEIACLQPSTEIKITPRVSEQQTSLWPTQDGG